MGGIERGVQGGKCGFVLEPLDGWGDFTEMTGVGGERGWSGGNQEFCLRYMKFELPFRHLGRDVKWAI